MLMSYRSTTHTWNDVILVKRSMIRVLFQFGASGYFSRYSLQYAMSHRSHCNWRPTLWLYYTDGLTVPRHAQHCDGQWLILDSYCASFKLLCHVTGSALSWRVVLSRCDVITIMLWQSFTVEVVLKVISVGTTAIRHIHVSTLQVSVVSCSMEIQKLHIFCMVLH